MKRAKYERQKARARPLFQKWAERLGLQNYTITVTYYDSKKRFCKEANASRDTVMSVTPDWRYLFADIQVNVPALVSMSDDDLEQCVIHELLHVVVNPVFGDQMRRTSMEKSLEERVVSHLTKILWETLDKEKKV